MRTGFAGPFRPPLLPVPLGVVLEGYTLISWAIPPERLKGLLPPMFRPATTVLDGRPVAWFSAFVGRNRLRTVGPFPALPLRFAQLNYRTYVQHADGHGLYFLKSVVGDPLAAAGLRALAQFPADWRPFEYTPTIRGDRLAHVSAKVGFGGSEADLDAESTGEAPATAGFASSEASVAFLGDVGVAAFSRGAGRFGTMISVHPPLRPEGGRLNHARLAWPVERGLLTPDEVARPDSVLMQAMVDFPTYV
jgi:hypothetical protein